MATHSSYAERHIRSLGLAKECAALGARLRTISYVTGLPHGQLVQLFFADHKAVPRGRPPDSPDWYHSANLLYRTEASIVASIYRRIRELDFGPAEALVAAYKHYLSMHHGAPRISFDRAFDLAAHLDGLWLVRAPSFSLATCPTCASQYLTAVGAAPVTNQECPFCKLLHRYRRDPRIQTSFPVSVLPDFTILQLGIIALAKQTREG